MTATMGSWASNAKRSKEGAGASRSRYWLRHPWLMATLAYAVASVLVTHRVWSDPTGSWIGARNDPQLFLWWLDWMPYALKHGLNPLHPSFVQYPLGTNALWNTSILLPSLLLTPVTVVFGPVVSWNLLQAAAPVLSALVAMAAVDRFVQRRAAAFLGGLIYGFSPYMIVQLEAHPHLLLTAFPPLMLLGLHELFIRQRRSVIRQRRSAVLVGIGLGLAATAQLVTGEEILLITAIGSGLVVALTAAMYPRLFKHWKRGLKGLIVAGVVALATSAPLLGYQLAGPQKAGCCLPTISQYVLDSEALVVPSRYQLLHTAGADQFANRWRGLTESNGYLGLPLLIALAAAVTVLRRRAEVTVSAAVLVTVILLAFGSFVEIGGVSSGITMPWRILRHIPLLGDIVTGRFMVLAYLAIGVIVAVAVDRLLALRHSARRNLLLAGVGFALLPLAPSAVIVTQDATPHIFGEHADLDRLLPQHAVALTSPVFETDAMRWQAVSGFRFKLVNGDVMVPGPMVNGPLTPLTMRIESLGPGDPFAVMAALATKQPDASPTLTPAERSAYVGELDKLKVNVVIVGPSSGAAKVKQFLEDLLHSKGQSAGSVTVFRR